MRVWPIISLLCIAAALPLEADEPRIIGEAKVIDGDGLRFPDVVPRFFGDSGRRNVRLLGIDAPEIRQICLRDNIPWRCGQTATRALRGKIGAKPVHCSQNSVGPFGRSLAVCWSGGVDLAGWMVDNGYAISAYSDDYKNRERIARDKRKGIWGANVRFVLPSEWRRGTRLLPD